MIRTIQQRIYVVGMLPLALLAVTLVTINGIVRINEANRQLRDAQTVTVQLLHGSAVDALVIGNSLAFEQIVHGVIKASPAVACVALTNTDHQTVASAGDCDRGALSQDLVPISARTEGLSDLAEPGSAIVVGELRVSMNQNSVLRKRDEVIAQLALSLLLTAAVLVVVARVLRSRLIQPVRQIDDAMASLSQRDYSVRVKVQGDDDLARLARAVNDTIETIASYTTELEQRRKDADRALHDADEANLARDGLVRSLTEDLEGPMNLMHSELTAIAMTNQDAALREPIKAVMALLQEAQANFDDLIEVATSLERNRSLPTRDLNEFVADFRRDIAELASTQVAPINLLFAQIPETPLRRSGVSLDLDAVRVRKALVYLVRAMARRCKPSGVQMTMELAKASPDELHLSIHLMASYPVLRSSSSPDVPLSPAKVATAPPDLLQLTDRESKIIEYLLRTSGLVPTFSASPLGSVSVVLEASCHYVAERSNGASMEWSFATRPIATTVITDDESLTRLTTRGVLSNHEITRMSFSDALNRAADLLSQDALLIDISDDVAAAFTLLTRLQAGSKQLPQLIAICPPGRISDSLGERLFQLGFGAMVQKPLQYSRLLKIVRASLTTRSVGGEPLDK
jgi:HAMP domain-containing protein